MGAPAELARCLVDDVRAAVERGPLQLLLAGPKSSAARPMPDGATPEPRGWNRIQLVVQDISA
jgi:hypothetical protein